MSFLHNSRVTSSGRPRSAQRIVSKCYCYFFEKKTGFSTDNNVHERSRRSFGECGAGNNYNSIQTDHPAGRRAGGILSVGTPLSVVQSRPVTVCRSRKRKVVRNGRRGRVRNQIRLRKDVLSERFHARPSLSKRTVLSSNYQAQLQTCLQCRHLNLLHLLYLTGIKFVYVLSPTPPPLFEFYTLIVMRIFHRISNVYVD